MTTAFNSRGKNAAAYPRFSGKLTKMTGDNEQVELAFSAETPETLTAALLAAGAAASQRLAINNDAIVRAGATLEERQRHAYDAALTTLRQEVTTMLQGRREEHEPPEDEDVPVGPPAPGDAPAEEEPPADADPTARALHAAADP